MSNSSQIKSRKEEHVNIALNENVRVKGVTNGFEDFEIVPTSVPDLDFNEISLRTEFLGKTFDAPVLIAGMTGGYPRAEKINKSLARVCAKLGIPMGVGSQRAMITNKDTLSTFNVKEEVPDVYLIGNLGLVQFSLDFGLSQFDEAVEGVNADAMAIHVNPFQELCQPEGDLDWRGAWSNFKKITKHSKVPVIAKEVGNGIAWEEAVKFQELGASAIDVGGAGGTSWPKIELLRNEKEDALSLDDPVLSWGINTALATYEATSKVDIPVISTGGMYSGLAAGKALVMGSSLVGIARPVLQALIDGGEERAEKYLQRYILDIKRVMFLMGAETLQSLRAKRDRLVIMGRSREWLLGRKIIS